MRNVLQVDISGYLKENSKIHKLQSSDMWITSVKLSYLEWDIHLNLQGGYLNCGYKFSVISTYIYLSVPYENAAIN